MADLQTLRKFQALSPFEIKNELIELAKDASKTTQSAFLNAGRGNPNWIATTPREGFFLLGQFAVTESQRVMTESPGIGGMPHPKGIAGRLNAWLGKHADMPGAAFLSEMVKFAIGKFSFDPDAFVHELVDSIIGDNYPVPDRMLVHNERIVHEYLMWAMCGDPLPPGKFDLYAVEGGTAAMCYIFKSLKANRLLMPGDTIALGTPIFTPYLEMTHLEDYDLKVVNIAAPQENRFQYSDAEIKKLEDPKIKAFFIVNPGNPTGMAMSKETIAKIVKLVKTKRPDLMLLTDDVYGTFVENFRSLMGELPYNTIGVYSYSKYFGCTGWRLGVIATHENNLYDKMIADLPGADLSGADFSDAMVGVNIKNQGMGQMRTDLSNANLSKAVLAGADFNRSLMTFCNLGGANLRGANFYRVKLGGADLTGADVTGANFTEADLEGTVFRDVKGFGDAIGLDQATNASSIRR